MKLTIFAGITGFNKSEFIQSFACKSLELNGYPPNLNDPEAKKFIHYIKFEDELLDITESTDISRFLAKPSFHEKTTEVERAFSRIGDMIGKIDSEYVFLDMHLSCLYQSQFFPPLNASYLSELDPTSDAEIKVITLIDDVFQIWNNLKQREEEYPNTSLRLREILVWRSIEYLLGETVALNFTTESRRVTNYLFAVRHPFVSIYNLVFIENPICVYLSYPISKTREHLERISNINNYRKRMYEIAEKENIVVFDPVTIDELALSKATFENGNRVLTKEHRWPIEMETLVPEPTWPIKIPDSEVDEAMPDISNQIRPRDFKYVDSSIITSVFRKNYGGPSTGVSAEIQYANSRGKRVYVYDPVEDAIAGIPNPFDQDVIGSRDLEAFFESLVKGIDTYRKTRR